MLNDDVLYLSVAELGQRIKARKLSPVELTEAYLDRSEKLGPKYNAYATITREHALKQARAADDEIRAGKYRGPLHGIPYAPKDLLATKGIPTTWGAAPYRGQVFDFDATVIRKLNQAGAVMLGKAAMIELAGGMGYRFGTASWSGGARNPWDASCWTCGSSSGSGAIMPAALAAFAIGTETWGSIVCPSAYCGVSGLRPTYGRVSRHGGMALSYSMDKIGPMCRTAVDCELVLAAISGADPKDATTLPPRIARFRPSLISARPLRIGWMTNQWSKVTPGIDGAVNEARSVLEKSGAKFKDVKLPEGPWEPAAGVIISVEGASAFQELIESGRVAQLTDPGSQLGGYVSAEIPASDFFRAQRIRAILQGKMAELFREQEVDVLCAASLPMTATKMEADLEKVFEISDPIGAIGNLCGLPAISVPCGFEDGKPVGIQFVGPVMGEGAVLAAAKAYQRNTDWHKKRPPV